MQPLQRRKRPAIFNRLFAVTVQTLQALHQKLDIANASARQLDVDFAGRRGLRQSSRRSARAWPTSSRSWKSRAWSNRSVAHRSEQLVPKLLVARRHTRL